MELGVLLSFSSFCRTIKTISTLSRPDVKPKLLSPSHITQLFSFSSIGFTITWAQSFDDFVSFSVWKILCIIAIIGSPPDFNTQAVFTPTPKHFCFYHSRDKVHGAVILWYPCFPYLGECWNNVFMIIRSYTALWNRFTVYRHHLTSSAYIIFQVKWKIKEKTAAPTTLPIFVRTTFSSLQTGRITCKKDACDKDTKTSLCWQIAKLRNCWNILDKIRWSVWTDNCLQLKMSTLNSRTQQSE